MLSLSNTVTILISSKSTAGVTSNALANSYLSLVTFFTSPTNIPLGNISDNPVVTTLEPTFISSLSLIPSTKY